MSTRARDEHATATLELVILAPLVFLVLSLMFAFGRVAQAESLLDQAARDGARAATAQNSRSAVPEVVTEVVEETMGSAPTSCRDSVDVRSRATAGAFELPDLTEPLAVEQVQVTLTCQIDLADLTFLPFDSLAFDRESRFVSPLDRYRGYRS